GCVLSAQVESTKKSPGTRFSASGSGDRKTHGVLLSAMFAAHCTLATVLLQCVDRGKNVVSDCSRPRGVFAPLVGALVFKTSGGFEQSSQWVRFPYTPV